MAATVVDTVVAFVFAFRTCVPRAFAPDPLDVTWWDPVTFWAGGLALVEGTVVGLTTRALAAFAACATNIPVAIPELRKMACVRSRTRANFLAIG